jgi:hypothetical protein
MAIVPSQPAVEHDGLLKAFNTTDHSISGFSASEDIDAPCRVSCFRWKHEILSIYDLFLNKGFF